MSNNSTIDNNKAISPSPNTPDPGEELLDASPIPDPMPDAVLSSMPTENSGNKKQDFITAGEKIHNEITYRGVDWLLSSALGVAFTYWAAKTKTGQEYYSKPVTNFFRNILNPVLRSEKSLAEGAKWGNMFTTICLGGTAIIPPLMVLENKTVKDKIIRDLDKKIYGQATVENDPKFEESYHRIAEEPRQDFKTGMAARIAILIPMLAVTMYPKTNKLMIKYLYDPIAKSTKWIAKTVGIKPGKMLTEGTEIRAKGDPNLPMQFQSNWDFLHATIGFDAGLTIIYSFLHESAYKAMAALGVSSKSNEAAAPPVATPQPEPIVLPEPEAKPFAHAEKMTPPGSFVDKIQYNSDNMPSLPW